MKKIKLITFVASILGFAIFSCTNESTEMDKTISEVINAKTIEFVGVEHNVMLDETYEFLKNQSSKKSFLSKSSKSKKERLEFFLISRVKSNRKYSDAVNKIGVENVKNVFREKQKLSKLTTYSKRNANSISNIEKQYLDALNTILDEIDFAKDNNIEENISNLEKDIEKENNLSNKQLITLFSATQTARYSYNYWKKNWKKWADLNSNSSTTTLKRLTLMNKGNPKNDGHNGCNCEDGKDIVKADVGGAVGAAATTWVVNAIPGAGQVGYGGAIVGGAVGTSVGAAVIKFLDWIW